MLRSLLATRYVTPLREGGSLPAIVEGGDDGLYVLKFRGAGQGPRALIAELLCGEIGRALGLAVPELVFMDLDVRMSKSEPDDEIRELLKASAGRNLALDYLPGSVMFEPAASPPPSAQVASDIVWFDAFITNVDRTAKNPNLLVWHQKHWLIDHGAALYFQHDWADWDRKSQTPFPLVKQHVLLPWATSLAESNARLRKKLTDDFFVQLSEQLPDAWLEKGSPFASPAEHRQAYARYFQKRLLAAPLFVEEAERARAGK